MTFDPHELIPLDEMTRARTPGELSSWVLGRCQAIADEPDAKEPSLLRRRPFKAFFEEIFPLSIFGVRRYPGRDDVLIVPNRDESRDFDAEVREPARTFKIEVTLARAPQEHLRMEYFINYGRVSLNGPVIVKGSKRTGRTIHNEVEFTDHTELREQHLGLVKVAAEGKSGRGRYGSDYELLIAVEDWWFTLENDGPVVTDFMAREVAALPLNFSGVHVIGWTDKLYCCLPLLS